VFNAELVAAGWTVEHVRVGGGTSAAVFARLRARAAQADLVVASAAVAPHQYRALGLTGGFAAFVEGLSAAGRPVVAVSFGSPYLLESFPSVPAYLLAWSGSEASQRAAARALAGRAPITGRLPVSLPPAHRAGEGIQRPLRPD
jgi:beta-N-acetylhexosaminidase